MQLIKYIGGSIISEETGRLIIRMIVLGLLIGGMFAYDHYKDKDKVGESLYISTVENDVYVCYRDEVTGKVTMHKDDVTFLKDGYTKVAVSVEATKFDFACGLSEISKTNYSISKTEPETSRYHEKCNECFEVE